MNYVYLYEILGFSEDENLWGMVRMGVGKVVGWYFVGLWFGFSSFYDGRVSFERCDWRRGVLRVSHGK